MPRATHTGETDTPRLTHGEYALCTPTSVISAPRHPHGSEGRWCQGPKLLEHADSVVEYAHQSTSRRVLRYRRGEFGLYRLYDMHCHLDFMSNAPEVASYAASQEVGILCATVTPQGYRDALSALQPHPNVWVGAGLHPWWIADSSCGERHRVCGLPHCRPPQAPVPTRRSLG